MGILQATILEWVAMPSSKGVFPTQGSNPGLPHCRWVLYHLSPREALGTPVDCISISFNVSANLSWKSLCLGTAPLV